jgi:hypothetical protein
VDNIQKPKANYGWITFWEFNKEEIDNQVNNYTTLKIYKSFKGISFLLLILSSIVSAIFAVTGFAGADYATFIDVAIMLIIGFFVFKGFRWAIVGAIILWTLEKVIIIFDSGFSASPIIQVLWWAIYLHYFIGALKVENQRKK